MVRSDIRDSLQAVGFSYPLAIIGTEGEETKSMTVHENVLVASEDPEAVIEAIADPCVKIVTLTITEKGYHQSPDGGLDLLSDAVIRDLDGKGPMTAIGLLARGLATRCAKSAPLTVISCDNLPENGRRLRKTIDDFSRQAELVLNHQFLSFPNTMVDRITPATTEETKAFVAERGHTSQFPVIAERFSEWVIEDNFAAERPQWEKAGVTIAKNVAPFELRKLRMLNAAHSLLAYGGLIRGHDYVHQAISDPYLKDIVTGLWDEAAETLPKESRVSADAYQRDLLERFAQPAMKHELRQIASDGTLKMQVRILSTLQERQKRGRSVKFCTSAFASWLAFWISGKDAPDPKRLALMETVASSNNEEEVQKRILGDVEGGHALDPLALRDAVSEWLDLSFFTKKTKF